MLETLDATHACREARLTGDQDLPYYQVRRIRSLLRRDKEQFVRSLSVKLKSGKAAGICAITDELIKVGGEPMAWVHAILVAIWRFGTVPPDLLRGVVIPLRKPRSNTLLRGAAASWFPTLNPKLAIYQTCKAQHSSSYSRIMGMILPTRLSLFKKVLSGRGLWDDLRSRGFSRSVKSVVRSSRWAEFLLSGLP
nr:uncharacterized protein LOC113827144 [Penaeus vannamei]